MILDEFFAGSSEIISHNKFDDCICLYCGKKSKKAKGSKVPLHHSNSPQIIAHILKAAQIFDNEQTLQILDNRAADAPVAYHNSCKVLYDKKITEKSTETTEWHEIREFHKDATTYVLDHVKKIVLEERTPILLKKLLHMYETRYINLFNEKHGHALAFKYQAHIFLPKLKTLGDAIQIITIKKNKIVAPAGDFEIDSKTIDALLDSSFAQEFALQIRNELLNVSKTPLPENLEEKHLIAGECEIPEKVKTFVRTIICGETPASYESVECNRKVESIAQDLIYAANHGKVKTSKHICLAIALKSLTSSRKIIDIINKSGHCCSYTVTEELETEATYHVSSKNTLCPDGVIKQPEFFTRVAWDNFDRYVETLGGHDTLHDTVGILIQNKFFSAQNSGETSTALRDVSAAAANDENVSAVHDFANTESEDDNDNDLPEPKRRKTIMAGEIPLSDVIDENISENEDVENNRIIDTDGTRFTPKTEWRRSFHAAPKEIPPYPKKPKVVANLLPVDDPLRSIVVDDYDFIRKIDLLWVMSHREKVDKTPMWVGFNSKIIEDTSPEQNVFYLPPINKSPTDPAVVYETMRLSDIIAKECKQNEIVVVYDLAIAKIAWQIQCEERNSELNFNHEFFDLGDFHLKMAAYNAIGTLINGCGLLDVAVDCGVLAGGSVNGILSGKHYNRCKRLHTIMSLALQILHFEAFLENLKEDIVPHNLQNILIKLQKKK